MRVAIALSALLLTSSVTFGQETGKVFNWTGFYVGIHGGFSAGTIDVEPANNEADQSYSGALLGLQAGYNTEISDNILLGFEGSISWSGAKGIALVDIAAAPFGNQYEGTDFHTLVTLAPRLSYTMDNVVIYAKAGLAVTTFDAYFRDDSKEKKVAHSAAGALFGFGAEYAITENLSVRGEYNFINFGTNPRFNGFNTYNATTTQHAFTVGLNFHPQ